jgi:hypothetical protein
LFILLLIRNQASTFQSFPFSENTFGDGKITPKEAKYGGLYVKF